MLIRVVCTWDGWKVARQGWRRKLIYEMALADTQDGEKLRQQDETSKVDLRDLICLHIFTLLQHLAWTKNLFSELSYLHLVVASHLSSSGSPPFSVVCFTFLSRSLTHMVFEISINSVFLNQFQDGHLKSCDLMVSKLTPHPISMQDHLWPQFPMDGCWGHLWMSVGEMREYHCWTSSAGGPGLRTVSWRTKQGVDCLQQIPSIYAGEIASNWSKTIPDPSMQGLLHSAVNPEEREIAWMVAQHLLTQSVREHLGGGEVGSTSVVKGPSAPRPSQAQMSQMSQMSQIYPLSLISDI